MSDQAAIVLGRVAERLGMSRSDIYNCNYLTDASQHVDYEEIERRIMEAIDKAQQYEEGRSE